ncbi:MAG: hypothetical protein FJ398_13460 [Verrucomicrobia bacterium]|nr:hypothetical protein [Verrucomicrobiota bacterium]
MATTVLWVYIVLLLAGGLMGFLKAGSKISLITSGVFALALSGAALGWLGPAYVADILLALLLAVFAARYAKGRKFMPAGFMGCVTLIAILLRRLF